MLMLLQAEFLLYCSSHINYQVKTWLLKELTKIRMCTITPLPSITSLQPTQILYVSYPLSVSNTAVVSVVRLEVWVSSVPPRVCVTPRPGVSQETVGFLRADANITDRDHLC